MLVRLDQSSQLPLYEQVAAQVRRAVGTGELVPGDRLPAAKVLAADIGVNLHTVLRAYGLLRDDGVIELRPYRGAVVSAAAQKAAPVLDEVRKFIDLARRHGMSRQEILDLVGEQL
ncbi:MAG TPA: GntR family transcriptional regulator [Acidimicrobiales bacterium]|nr:GntR family transcriptional regulator [Acidimicrobiales bacterium]